jgi:hypothetical protein
MTYSVFSADRKRFWPGELNLVDESMCHDFGLIAGW